VHRSRLAGFIVDCQTDDLDGAARFWAGALGRMRRELPGVEGESYVALDDPRSGLHCEVQKVDHPSRVHLDLETDDVEAEARRLEALGARRIRQVRDFVVMEAPTGQRFCVIPAASERFAGDATVWP
jgi:predicted enzyme related to lactoylglutathione lyase